MILESKVTISIVRKKISGIDYDINSWDFLSNPPCILKELKLDELIYQLAYLLEVLLEYKNKAEGGP